MATVQRTTDYVARRTEEDKTRKEVMRCLKRYVSRKIYGQLTNPGPAQVISDFRPMQQQLGLALRTAAGYSATWPGTVSRIEGGLSRDSAHEYMSWPAGQHSAEI